MSDDIRTILGELVIAFAALEDSLTEGLAQIVNIDYMNAKIIFSTVSFQKKTQIIKALLKQNYSKEDNLDIYKLLLKANTLEAERNRLIHSDWEYIVKNKKDGTYNIIIKRTKLKYNKKEAAQIIAEKIGIKERKQFKEIIRQLEQCSSALFVEFGQIGSYLNSKRCYKKS